MPINIEANNFIVIPEAVHKRICMRGMCRLCQYLEERIILENKDGLWIGTDNIKKNILEQLKKILKSESTKS